MSQVKNLVDAIDTFIAGCKSDGIWDPIKAACIMAGWDGLNGALIPLKGTAPTNFNFVSGDYNRKTGLVGDGNTKYLDSNRANNSDPQNSNHNACYVTSATSADPSFLMGNSITGSDGKNRIVYATLGGGMEFDSRSVGGSAVTGLGSSASSFVGHSRNTSSSIVVRAAGASTAYTQASANPNNENVYVFSRESGQLPSNARLAFYSIGESLDLALLDARVSTLITEIGAAIP